MKRSERFKRGEQKLIAARVGITPQKLSDILRGRRKPSVEQAVKLSASCALLDYDISFWDWLNVLITRNKIIAYYANRRVMRYGTTT